MLPVHVALVPYEDELVDTGELLRVAAALQMQLTRDFEPVWGIPATVSAFTSLDQIPPAWIPLVIVEQGTLLPREHAFHTTAKGTPIGLIEKRDGWSLAASHELLEIVCDPQGKRKVMAESIADSHPREVVDGATPYAPQGQVAYLLEICDPCQDVYYIVNGFQVSDFVTSRYYAPGTTECGCYSFTGEVKRPRELLNGGYITWYTSIEESPIWQAKRDRFGVLTIGPMVVPAPASSRDDVDYANEVFESLEPSAPRGDPAAQTEALAKISAERYGAELRTDVASVLDDIYRAQPQVSVDALVPLLRDLAEKPGYYQDFHDNENNFRSQELTRRLGYDVTYPGGVPQQPQFKKVYAAVQATSQRQPGQHISGKIAATLMEGQT